MRPAKVRCRRIQHLLRVTISHGHSYGAAWDWAPSFRCPAAHEGQQAAKKPANKVTLNRKAATQAPPLQHITSLRLSARSGTIHASRKYKRLAFRRLFCMFDKNKLKRSKALSVKCYTFRKDDCQDGNTHACSILTIREKVRARQTRPVLTSRRLRSVFLSF